MNRKIVWVCLFAIAFALVESAVVVYLRALYYPGGFAFPLKPMSDTHRIVELARESATIIMLVAVGAVNGTDTWEQFGYFMIAFGVWDIFYYCWLKVFLNWPRSILDPDILFLLPLPWIGPVLVPVLVSLLMIAAGMRIIRSIERTGHFHPPAMAVVLSSLASFLLLYTFMFDLDATIRFQPPHPYPYVLMIFSFLLYVVAFILAFRSRGHATRRI